MPMSCASCGCVRFRCARSCLTFAPKFTRDSLRNCAAGFAVPAIYAREFLEKLEDEYAGMNRNEFASAQDRQGDDEAEQQGGERAADHQRQAMPREGPALTP